MKYITLFALALGVLSAFPESGNAQDLAAQTTLTQAKRLYESASYSEALSVLTEVSGTAEVTEVEKYRALCLLALERPAAAEEALERLTLTRPLYTLSADDTSPKLVAMFQSVRKRTLPEASKQTYERARTRYASGDFAEASRLFKDVIAMADIAPQESAAMMGDLKLLAAGFLTLAENALAPKSAEAPAAAAVAPTVAPPTRVRVYDSSTAAAKVPVAIYRPIPTWQRPAALNFTTLQGLLEVVVAEDGSVLEDKMIKGINPAFDRLLMDGAKAWRFEPATLDGHPVRYRMTIAIVVPKR